MIIISEANRLSKGAQHALRRTMEKYMAQCRLILLTESISKLIPALRSRCLGIRLVLYPEISIAKCQLETSLSITIKFADDNFRVKAPSEQEIENVLEKVSTQEMIELSTNQQSQIVKSKSHRLWTVDRTPIFD